MKLFQQKNGYGKRTSYYDYRVTNRGGKGIIGIINSSRNGNVASSFPVNDGDEISLSDKSKQIPSVLLAVQSKDREVPDYLTVDYVKMKGIFVKTPRLKDVPYPAEMEPNLVVEFYSR